MKKVLLISCLLLLGACQVQLPNGGNDNPATDAEKATGGNKICCKATKAGYSCPVTTEKDVCMKDPNCALGNCAICCNPNKPGYLKCPVTSDPKACARDTNCSMGDCYCCKSEKVDPNTPCTQYNEEQCKGDEGEKNACKWAVCE
jgi:hypothetical protein